MGPHRGRQAGEGRGPRSGQESLVGRREEASENKGVEVKLPCSGEEPKRMLSCACSRSGLSTSGQGVRRAEAQQSQYWMLLLASGGQ